MYQRKRVTAVILAAGSGSRMGGPVNKVHLPLDERPVIAHTMAAFAEHPYVDELVLVAREGEQETLEAVAAGVEKPCRIVIGGATRQASVYNAIAGLKSKLVLVHDGARPLVGAACISACVEALARYDGVIPAMPVAESVYSVGGRGTKPRRLTQSLYAAQTPQGFHMKVLRRCHKRHRHDPASTDDSRLLELEGYKVGIVAGDPRNLKITTPLDLEVAQAYFVDVRG